MSQLFGVPVPDGAVKATIKPLLGRGQTKAMWSGPIEKDGIAVDECDIVSDVSDNAAFWQYVDLQVQAKRITAKSDGVWLFRLIVIFEDVYKRQAFHRATASVSSYRALLFSEGRAPVAAARPL